MKPWNCPVSPSSIFFFVFVLSVYSRWWKVLKKKKVPFLYRRRCCVHLVYESADKKLEILVSFIGASAAVESRSLQLTSAVPPSRSLSPWRPNMYFIWIRSVREIETLLDCYLFIRPARPFKYLLRVAAVETIVTPQQTPLMVAGLRLVVEHETVNGIMDV